MIREDGCKQCRHCGLWLPVKVNYYVNDAYRDGYGSWCRTCVLANMAKWTADHAHVERKPRKHVAKTKAERNEAARLRYQNMTREQKKVLINRQQEWSRANRDKVRVYKLRGLAKARVAAGEDQPVEPLPPRR